MAIRRDVTVTLGHVTDVRQQVSVLKNQVKTTTTYQPTEVTYPRGEDGDDGVPVSCGYPGCGKSVVVRVSSTGKARRERRRMFLISGALLAGLVLDVALLSASVAVALGFVLLLLVLPLAVGTLMTFGAAVSYAGDQRAAKLSGHLIRGR